MEHSRLFILDLDGPAVTVQIDSQAPVPIACGSQQAFASHGFVWHLVIRDARSSQVIFDRRLGSLIDQIVQIRTGGVSVTTGAFSAGPPPVPCLTS
jgi:hypothetical protein